MGSAANKIIKYDCPLIKKTPLMKPYFNEYDDKRKKMAKAYVVNRPFILSTVGGSGSLDFFFVFFFFMFIFILFAIKQNIKHKI